METLIQKNIFKLPDGRDLFEGSCEELAGLLKGDGENETYAE
ncbi:Fur-regulated basic protein FbpA [Bacillus thuringiensis]|nr:Fur-regulated basic protein FbpA [Bacillus thuringiensis]